MHPDPPCVVELFCHHHDADRLYDVNGDMVDYLRGMMLCVPMSRAQFAHMSPFFFNAKYPATRLHVSGYWSAAAGGGRAIFGVPLTVQGVPYRNHVMNALNGFVAPRKRTPCQVCIDVMDWSRPYRFDMIRDHVVRLRFMKPDDGLEGDDHWKRLIQLDKDTFQYLVARIMAEKDWSRCRKK